MKPLSLLVLSILLSGCGLPAENPMNIAKSKYACRDKGGMYSVGTWKRKAVCNNGEYVNLPKVIEDSKYYPKNKE